MRIVKTLPRKGRQSADWRESIDTVLKSIDRQLAVFGLEVVQEEALSDTASWVIAPRTPKKPKRGKNGAHPEGVE